MLLLTGVHDGPLALAANKEVHVFGRGQAVLRTSYYDVVTCSAVTATLDGLIIRREAVIDDEGDELVDGYGVACVVVSGGRLRLQACDLAGTAFARGAASAWISGGTDPVFSSCKCVAP